VNINGTPLHPLVVHAAVVLTPVAALCGILFAIRGPWRWWLRWPLVVSAVLATGAVGLSYLSGHQLLNQRFAGAQGPLRDAINAHRHWAHLLIFASGAYAVIAVLGAWALGGPSALASGWGARETRASWRIPAIVLLIVGALVVLVLVILTGDAGARAVWNP